MWALERPNLVTPSLLRTIETLCLAFSGKNVYPSQTIREQIVFHDRFPNDCASFTRLVQISVIKCLWETYGRTDLTHHSSKPDQLWIVSQGRASYRFSTQES